MRNGPQVNILQLTPQGHASGQTGDFDAPLLQGLGEHMRSGLAFGREVGGQNHFLDRPINFNTIK